MIKRQKQKKNRIIARIKVIIVLDVSTCVRPVAPQYGHTALVGKRGHI